MDIGFSSIETRSLQAIEGHDFEDFCAELIRGEARLRHVGAEVQGPPPKYVADGGEDVSLVVRRRPKVAREDFPYSLTEDHLGSTYFSCKTGKDQRAVRSAILKDVREQPQPLEVVQGGGHYSILTNLRIDKDKKYRPRDTKATTKRTPPAGRVKKGTSATKGGALARTLHQEIAQILSERVQKESDVAPPDDLAGRIHIYDANDITAFLKRHRPSLSTPFKRILGIGDVPGLVSFGVWEVKHYRERALPTYRADREREVPPDLCADIADADVTDLEEDPPDIQSLERGGLTTDVILFLARYQPARMGRILRRVVDDAQFDMLRARGDIWYRLVFALQHLVRRRASFEDAEAALFKLALAENDSHPSNARSVWASLFLVTLNPTYRSASERIDLLRERIQSGGAAEIAIVLRGLEAAVSSFATRDRFEGDEADGPWPRPTRGEATSARRDAWTLISLLSVHMDPCVAATARRIAVKHVRGLVRAGEGADVLQLLANVAEAWDDAARGKLREKLDEMESYDRAFSEQPGVAAALVNVRRTLLPRSYHERLVSVVGRWRSWRGKVPVEQADAYEAEADRSLAEEGTADSTRILQEIDWLDSPAAVRATSFMTKVGHMDAGRSILRALTDRARSGVAQNMLLLPSYVGGVAESGHEDEVDALLRGWRPESRMALHTMLVVWRVGPNRERVGWIVEDLEADRLRPIELVSCLATGGWGKTASTDDLRRLTKALLRNRAPVAWTTALTLLVDRVSTHRDDLDVLLPQIVSSLKAVASAGEVGPGDRYEWERGAGIALAADEREAVLDAAVDVIRHAPDLGAAEHGWNVLHMCSEQVSSGIWRRLVDLLDDADVVDRVVMEVQSRGAFDAMPADEVLAWVGQSSRRGAVAAGMCSVHSPQLGTVARGLLIRFGPKSDAARVLSSNVHSTPRAVTSLSGFVRQQMAHAEAWRMDPAPSVSNWAKGVLGELASTLENYEAHEEYERRVGT